MVKKVIWTVLVLVALFGIVQAMRARGAGERAEANAQPLFVPVVMTPSIQMAGGQVMLVKATNLSEDTPVNFRVMYFNDQGAVPETYEDFMQVRPGVTVARMHTPKAARLTVDAVTVSAPEPVRVMVAPIPGDQTPNAMRRVLVNVQLLHVKAAAAGSEATLEPPTIVPLSHCRFEPRGFVPYTGGRWYWNCALGMDPVDEMWRSASQADREAGTKPY